MKRRRKKTLLDVAADEAQKWAETCRVKPSFVEVILYAMAWKDGFEAAKKAAELKENQP